jgi:4'-phosphopantetheinyl transferase
VDVWTARLDPPVPSTTELARCLSVEEQERSERMPDPRHRARYVAGRAFMRLLLARYVGGTADTLRLDAATDGKPVLTGAARAVAFNLSHSGDLAVGAVAEGSGDIGVDIEQVRPLKDEEGIARLLLSGAERASLETLAPAERLRRLFWTRACKESLLKGVGSGLNRPLDDIELSFADGDQFRIDHRSRHDDLAGFTLHPFEPAAGFVGVLAVRESVSAIRYHEWRWEP